MLYLLIGFAIFILELLIFIINMIIFHNLRAEEKRLKKERREARRLRTMTSQVQNEKAEDKDVGEFVCIMIDTAKLAPPSITF